MDQVRPVLLAATLDHCLTVPAAMGSLAGTRSGKRSSFGVAWWRNRAVVSARRTPPGPADGVPHVGGVLRTPGAEHLEVDILLESLEQPLPAAQHERRGGDRELVYYSRRKTSDLVVGGPWPDDGSINGTEAASWMRSGHLTITSPTPMNA